MMTTDRTAIRSRLAVRGTTHRPPWGGRKAGHRSIVAPLAATLAASLALAVAVALAKADRDRRSARRRRLDRKLGLLAEERLAAGLQRMALGQIDVAIEQLTRAGEREPAEKAVHETRKALKRLRALIRLLEHELGEHEYARESAALREIAQQLSDVRDALVMLNTLDALIARHPRRLSGGGVKKLRKRLLAEHARTQQRMLEDPATRTRMIAQLEALRTRVAAWQLHDRKGLRLIEGDLTRLYRQGRKRYQRIARRNRGDMKAMHEWRKRVKDLRYATEMLERRNGKQKTPARPRGKKRRRAHAHARRENQRVQRIARRADELGELLGEEHDLAVLSERIRSGKQQAGGPKRQGANAVGSRVGGEQPWHTGRRTRKTLLKLTARRKRQLRAQALRAGKRLYRDTPGRFRRRVRQIYEASQRDGS
jgi:CHAD domain-containing protein